MFNLEKTLYFQNSSYSIKFLCLFQQQRSFHVKMWGMMFFFGSRHMVWQTLCMSHSANVTICSFKFRFNMFSFYLFAIETVSNMHLKSCPRLTRNAGCWCAGNQNISPRRHPLFESSRDLSVVLKCLTRFSCVKDELWKMSFARFLHNF